MNLRPFSRVALIALALAGIPAASAQAHAASVASADAENLANFERRATLAKELGANRVILMTNRRAEERHEAIAEELVHGALVTVDPGKHQLEGAVHQGGDVLEIQALGQRGETRDIHEEHGDELALTLERAARGQNLLGEMTTRTPHVNLRPAIATASGVETFSRAVSPRRSPLHRLSCAGTFGGSRRPSTRPDSTARR